MTTALSAEPSPPWREVVCHVIDKRDDALRAFALVFGGALAVAALLPAQYRATAILSVLPSPEFTVRQAAGSHEVNASALAMDQIMKAETEILGSDDLHEATLQRVGHGAVYPDIFVPGQHGASGETLKRLAHVALSPWRVTPADPAAARTAAGLKRFAADLAVLPAKDSNVITVRLDNRDARMAATALNAMLAVYAAKRRRLYDDPQTEIVRAEAEAGRRALGDADQRLADFKRAHGIFDFDQQRGLLLQRRNLADQAAADAAIASAENRARLAAVRRQLVSEPATVGIFDELDTDTRLQAANAGLQDLRAKLAAASDKYRDSSRLVTMLRAQIASHEAEVRRLSRGPAASVVRRGRNPALDPLHLDLDRAAAELAAGQARLAAAQGESQAVGDALGRLGLAETGFLALQRQRDTIEESVRTASRILAERQLSEAEDARRLANVHVIQPAMVPEYPRPTPLLIIAAGLVFAMLAACCRIMGRYLLRPVFLTDEGLAAATGLPVLAVFGRETEAPRQGHQPV